MAVYPGEINVFANSIGSVSVCMYVLVYLKDKDKDRQRKVRKMTHVGVFSFCFFFFKQFSFYMQCVEVLRGIYVPLCVCHSKDRKPSLFVFLAAPSSLNSPIVERRTGDITQPAVFDVSVLKEPLIAIRISLNKRLRNIGWFLAFASHPSLLTSRV